MFGPCFVMHYFVSTRGRESWLLYFNFIFDVMWLLVFCGTSLHVTVPWVGLQCVIKDLQRSNLLFEGATSYAIINVCIMQVNIIQE